MMTEDKLISLFQSCHLNFLLGSGLSTPFLTTLGSIEKLLTELSASDLSDEQKEIIRASILSKYFEQVIYKNVALLEKNPTDPVLITILNNYKIFLTSLQQILLRRASTIINKQINLFTTNIDLFLEKTLEDSQLEFNDGFMGRIRPNFSLTNFNKILHKKTSHYDNIVQMPLFNVLKVHGSLTWAVEENGIVYSNLDCLKAIETARMSLSGSIIDFDHTFNLNNFADAVRAKTHTSSFGTFLSEYGKLAIVNPTKGKFQETVLNLNYSELLRIFANEMEKESTLLIIMGFSLADEHIREILLRAANSNPTLTILIYAYDISSANNIRKHIKDGNVPLINKNIIILEPDASSVFDFAYINAKVIKPLYNKIVGV